MGNSLSAQGGRLRLLVLGANGQIGWELLRHLQLLGEVVAAARGPEVLTVAGKSLSVDLAEPDSIRQLVRSVQPSLIVNAAAHTAVDLAESEPELCMAINGIAPGILAEEARRCGAPLIHYSTDYVFDGRGDRPWRETDAAGPLSTYGRSKRVGELSIAAVGGPHLILRTSWVYGVHGMNFVKKMLSLGSERSSLSIVADQIGAPTSARAVAAATAQIIALGPQDLPESLGDDVRIMHMACGGEASWHDFACEIFRLSREQGCELAVKQVRAIPSEQFPTPARRPKNSRLDCSQLEQVFGIRLPEWRDALRDSFPALLQTWRGATSAAVPVLPLPDLDQRPAGDRRERTGTA